LVESTNYQLSAFRSPWVIAQVLCRTDMEMLAPRVKNAVPLNSIHELHTWHDFETDFEKTATFLSKFSFTKGSDVVIVIFRESLTSYRLYVTVFSSVPKTTCFFLLFRIITKNTSDRNVLKRTRLTTIPFIYLSVDFQLELLFRFLYLNQTGTMQHRTAQI
jgi:hypothetical protein